jgi:hypothetical protein
VAETAFRIAYDGPALESGTMPVRDLAPALLALGQLFAEAGQIVYPESGPVALNIKATETGSFDVHLILEAEDLWDQFVDLFGTDAVTALVNLKALITGGSLSLLGFIRWLRGRRIEREEPAPRPGHVRITVEDASIEIPADVAKMYKRISIRRKARDVVAPLAREGVEEVRFAEAPGAVPELVIDKGDVSAYETAATEEGDVLLDEEREMVAQLASVSFEEGHKWRLSDGAVTFWAAIEDDEFLAYVKTRDELFGQGDLLRCRMRIVQTRRAGKLHTDYYVVQVLAHIQGHMQPALWDDATDDVNQVF